MQTVENACGTITPAQAVKAATNFEKRLYLCTQVKWRTFQAVILILMYVFKNLNPLYIKCKKNQLSPMFHLKVIEVSRKPF